MRPIYRLTNLATIVTAIVLCSVLALAMPVNATIINVPADQPTIQAGIDNSSDTDTVLVAPGTYYENINFHGKKIVLTSNFMFDRDPSFIFSTVINGSQPTNPDTASCVRFHTGEDATTILQGFTLTGGKGTKWVDEHGFGTYREGGGILCQGSEPTIQFNLITNNEATVAGTGIQSAGGGAIRAGDGYPHIKNNVITYNKGRYGAGIVLNFCGGEIRNNVIAYNSGGQDFGGSGIWKYGSGPAAIVDNNTIVYNISTLGGGGIYCSAATMTISSNIIRGNVGPPNDQILGGGSVSASYCNIEGGFAGSNIIDVDPQFYGEYFYLPDGSPSVDAGKPGIFTEDSPDPNSPTSPIWPSRGTLTNDQGAFGGPDAYPFEWLTLDADTTIGWAPIDVQFNASCRFGVTSWDWDFGDGQTDNVGSPLHTYALGGLYDVTVAADTGGGMLSTTRSSFIIALADSLSAPDIIAPKNSTVVVPVSARNVISLSQLIIPLRIHGPIGMVFDSFSTVGCRTDYFEIQQRINSDNSNRRYTVKLVSSASGTSPDLAPGSGPVLNLFFSVPWDVPAQEQDTISLDGYGSYQPLFAGTSATYAPRILSGTVAAQCCQHRGNVDGVVGPGGPVDISDVTSMVAWLFGLGPIPPCDDEANVDGVYGPGGPVDITDLTYLVGYLLQGGPPPPSCP